MTQAQAMLQVAQRSRRYLGGAADMVAKFTQDRWQPEGGFRGRSREGDLYYTVFGIETLRVLGVAFPDDKLLAYLQRFGAGEGLDFVHLCALARCWALLPAEALPVRQRVGIIKRIAAYRTKDGGFNAAGPNGVGQLTACFLAGGAYESLGIDIPGKLALAGCFRGCRAADGALGNEPGMAQGTTTATAGAVVLLKTFHLPAERKLIDWLLAQHCPTGGFRASPGIAQPDLVSTAAALYALHMAGEELAGLRERCVEFIEGLWHEEGGFTGHVLDDVPDTEHTYYGLLSLGVLEEEKAST
jgi:hypothetical protein